MAQIFICLGQPPIAGCGRILTDEEIRYYGYCCESCQQAWADAIDAWKAGGENPEFDAMFDCRPVSH